jgi:uncharacterized membrane protein
MKKTIDIIGSIKKGWDVFKQRPWFMIGAIIITIAASFIAEAALRQFNGVGYTLVTLLNFAFQTLVGMGLTFVTLAVYDGKGVSYKDWFTPAPQFFKYLGVIILTMLAIMGGLILLIVPGIIAMIGLMFAPYLVIDKDMGTIEALKKSWEMSRGNRWSIFGLILALLVLNIIGMIALGVGLLVTIPVSSLAMVYVYRTLLATVPVIEPAQNE